MSRRLLDLCLLAYPRARRERDRDYLRDLALDLAEGQGLMRQAGSLLLGGLRERVASLGRWAWRAGAASLVVVALASAVVLAVQAHGTHAPGRRPAVSHVAPAPFRRTALPPGQRAVQDGSPTLAASTTVQP